MDASDEVIAAAYNAGVQFGNGLSIQRMTPQRFADTINDEEFAYNVFWVRFINDSIKPLLPYRRVTFDDIQDHDNEDIEYLKGNEIFQVEILYNQMALEAARTGYFNGIPFKEIRTDGVIPPILYEAVNLSLEEIV